MAWRTQARLSGESGRSLQHQANVAYRLFAACAVVSNDINQPVEDGRTDAGPCHLQSPRDVFSIGRMALLQLEVQVSDRLPIAQRLSGPRRISPSQHKTLFRCSKSSTQDVIEGVQISSPLSAGDQLTTDLI